MIFAVVLAGTAQLAAAMTAQTDQVQTAREPETPRSVLLQTSLLISPGQGAPAPSEPSSFQAQMATVAGSSTPSRSAEVAARAWFASPLPWLLGEGDAELITRASTSLHEPQPFDEGTGRRPERTHVRLGAEIAGGLGSQVEASVRFGLQGTAGEGDAAGVEDTGGPVADDVDLRIGWSPRVTQTRSPALAGWLQVKLPTGPDKGGASTDETDAGVGVSVGARAGRLSLFAHGGLLLLGNPLRNGAQDDIAGWGAGFLWPGDRAWSLTGEIEGLAFSRFGNSDARARAGMRWSPSAGDPGALSVGGILYHGLTNDSATWGVEILASLAR